MAQVESTLPLRPTTPPKLIQLPVPNLSPMQRLDPSHPQRSLKSGHFTLDTLSPVNKDGSFEFDRVIKSGKVQRRVKKKGAWKSSWKPGYLVLRPNLLSIYQNEDESGLVASVTLSDVTAVAPVKKTHADHVFGVFSASKNHHFQGLSAADTADWIAHIRSEARIDILSEVALPSPGFAREPGEAHYDSTDDPSAGEEEGDSRSPVATHWPPKGQKVRSRASTTQHRPPHINEYSGNELNTSHSDFSDVPVGSLPKSMATSVPHVPLSPIPSDQNMRPKAGRNVSHISTIDISNDPERVIRQGWLQILKTKGGVKQWKSLWVVLRPRNLSFYKNEQEYSAVKILPMSSIIDAAEIDPISRSKSFCLQIILEDKTYRCCAPDEEALAKWLGSLKSVLARRRDAKSLVEATTAMTIK